MRQLTLHAQHQQAGAHTTLYGNWELPEYYSDPVLEYRAVRENVGLADLSFQGRFLVTGRDRVTFLQSLVSNDLNRFSEGKGIYNALLTAKGRVMADFTLYPLPEALLMEIEWTNAEKTLQHLMRYRLRSQIKIETPPWGEILVSGPRARPVLGAFLGSEMPVIDEKSFFQRETEGFYLLCIKRSVTGEDDYHLYAPEESLEKLWVGLLSAGSAFGILPVGQAALEILRIEAGKPRYGIDMDEHIIPIEAGLEAEAISYTKGCYPGQEVMARIRTYGHVNKHLTGVVIEGEELPRGGDKIFQGEKELGWITSATKSPRLGKVIAMGYLRPQITAPGTAVEVEVNQIRRAAQVATLPLYRRASLIPSVELK